MFHDKPHQPTYYIIKAKRTNIRIAIEWATNDRDRKTVCMRRQRMREMESVTIVRLYIHSLKINVTLKNLNVGEQRGKKMNRMNERTNERTTDEKKRRRISRRRRKKTANYILWWICALLDEATASSTNRLAASKLLCFVNKLHYNKFWLAKTLTNCN